jgi:hypothetical protein
MSGRKREFFTPPNQDDPRLPAFEKYANQADCGKARFVVELLREAYAMKPRMFHCPLAEYRPGGNEPKRQMADS